MRIFLELIRPQTEDEANLGIPPQNLRYEVSSEEEAKKLYKALKSIMNLEGWEARIHFCRHDEGGSCEIKPLK